MPLTTFEYLADLRDNFAVHAPPAPEWFLPPVPVTAGELMPAPRPDFTGEEKELLVAQREQYRRERDQARQRLFQWPYAWADAQMKAREAAAGGVSEE